MRRFIIALTIIGLAVASCSLNPFDEPIVLKGKTVPVTINARQGDGDETKTVRNADKSVSWMPSEEILVICGTDKGKFISTNTENSPTVSFSGKLDEATVNAVNNGTSAYCVWGLYPYDENAESDGTYVTTTLPNVQTGVAGTFADDLFITLAKSNDFNLYFYNVCSGFKFSVTKAGVTSITIQGKNNEYLAGKVKLSFGGDGKPKVDEVLNGQKVITLTPEKSTFEVGKDYYFVTLPTDFSSGFTVTLNTPSETGVFDVSASLSFPRSKFVTKANVDAAVIYGAKVGNINIPDANFKAYCVANFDSDPDGEISYEEALSVTHINVSTDNISSLEGIEYFSNLTSLRCCGTYEFDSSIGKNVGKGELTSLDVSMNTLLSYLYCSYNHLTSLDVSKNSSLTYLDCGYNQLTSLGVSNNTSLTDLYCRSNQLSSLDVSKNSSLTNLACYSNQLTILDVSNNTSLKGLFCDSNQLQSLDVSKNTSLTDLTCSSNQLTSLDVSKNTSLKHLACYSNQLTSLDVSKNTSLTTLDCSSNPLTSLGVSNNTSLTDLYCRSNQLQSLDVSKNTSLTGLSCSSNQLTSLNVSKNTSLTTLDCDSNQLQSLDVSKNTSLTDLTCSSNQLTSLDVSKNTWITDLRCYSNQLTSLDVSKNTALTRLDCYSNNLPSLDVSNNSALTMLLCYSNPNLTEIWLKTGQTITTFLYDTSVATVKYKE